MNTSTKSVSKATAATAAVSEVVVTGFEHIDTLSELTLNLPLDGLAFGGKQVTSCGNELIAAITCLNLTTKSVKAQSEKSLRDSINDFTTARMVYLTGIWNTGTTYAEAFTSDKQDWKPAKQGKDIVGRFFNLGAIEFRFYDSEPTICSARPSGQYRNIKKAFMSGLLENPAAMLKQAQKPDFGAYLQKRLNTKTAEKKAMDAAAGAGYIDDDNDATAPVGTPGDVSPVVGKVCNALDSLKKAILETENVPEEMLEDLSASLQAMARTILGFNSK